MAPRVSETFRKDTIHDPGHGYGRNVGTVKKPVWVAERGINMSSEVVHTTNNPNKDTKPWSEATFIRDSPNVSCHDFIAKNGDVYVILPETMEAWHAGAALAAFTNRYSFGTELHCSIGETPTQAQMDSLAWRIRDRRTRYGVVEARIETHRFIALPKGRKSDPEGWSDTDFYAWRKGLFVPEEPDYSALWGIHYPYFAESGIAGAWRDNAAALGPATSDETGDAEGKIWRLFRGGAVSFNPGTGKTEVYVPRKA
jgi:hypothetical protein